MGQNGKARGVKRGRWGGLRDAAEFNQRTDLRCMDGVQASVDVSENFFFLLFPLSPHMRPNALRMQTTGLGRAGG